MGELPELFEGMLWRPKRVGVDGTTRGGFRWPVGTGGWVTQDGPKGGACGVGLHLGKTWAGLSQGGGLSHSIVLVCGFLPDDVLGENDVKVRVARCWVASGVLVDPVRLIRDHGVWADLYGADLCGADLSGADPDRWTRWPDGFDPATAGVHQ